MSSSSTTPTASTATNERDRNGRFAPGNAGGPGNPFAREVAAVRKTVLRILNPDCIERILLALVAKAEKGDVPAARLLLTYSVGKPASAADPDRLDADEWAKLKETAPMLKEATALLKTPEPILPLTAVRSARPYVTRGMSQQMSAMLKNPVQYREEMPDLEMVEDDLPPSPNGTDGVAVANLTGGGSPSANGDEAEWLATLAERAGFFGRPTPNGKKPSQN